MRILLVMLFFVIKGVAQNVDSLLIIQISNPPVYKDDLIHFIQTNIQYPLSAVRDSVQGRVNVAFMIDTVGNTFNHEILKGGIREDLNQEALRVTRLIKFEAPAFQKDRPIITRYVVPVDFRLRRKRDCVPTL
ncbi:MAG: TonB family protein [Parabacteroides sp.]|nr:TonB family protein [Parabacteroides sp.]